MDKDELFMKEALKEAQIALKKDEVPIGAVIVHNDKIIARGHNMRETKHDALGHAEIVAIRKANKKMKEWRLVDCTIYVTVEPCSMCAGAILQSRIGRIVYGTEDYKGGALGSSFNLFEQKNINHIPEIKSNVLKEECRQIIKDFFKNKR
ncbi:MAG: tRNA adenosine(34) deaminase TadA [Bacilli bacterium]